MSSVRFFTLDGAQNHDTAVERWFSAPPTELRSMARVWFQAMRSAGPDVLELLHDGHPTTCVGNLAFGYVNAFADHINVGFFFGAVLPDPAGLLEGTGRFMRHVKIRPGAFVHDVALRAIIIDAYADIKGRLADRAAT